MKFIITEEEKNQILGLYGINLVNEFIRPLQKLKECKITTDGKYIIHEDVLYSCETGEIVPINESISVSDIIHTVADVVSIGMDFVIPGSGAVVDTLNGISYMIEGEFKKTKEEKDTFTLMALITFGFAAIPSVLQGIAPPLKQLIKSGAKIKSPLMIKALQIIKGSLSTILSKLPSLVNSALKSPLAKNILGKWGPKISQFIKKFTSNATTLLSKISTESVEAGTKIATSKTGQKAGQIASSKYTKKLAKKVPIKGTKKYVQGQVQDYRNLMAQKQQPGQQKIAQSTPQKPTTIQGVNQPIPQLTQQKQQPGQKKIAQSIPQKPPTI
jgi:hypothetical protein